MGRVVRCFGAARSLNVPICGGPLSCFGAALRACGALPRAPDCWERSANRVLTPCHAEAFGTPSSRPGPRAIESHRPGSSHPQDRAVGRNVTHVGSCGALSCPRPARGPGRELGAPKASAWRCVRTRLALRSQQSGARGRAPQARSAAPKQLHSPPQIGTFSNLLGIESARPILVARRGVWSAGRWGGGRLLSR